MNSKITLLHKSKKIHLNVKELSEFGKVTGLMFSKREKARALLFKFDKFTRLSIHSLFVFFEFLAIWTDDKGEILEIKKIKPFKFSVKPKKKFKNLIEVPFNKKYESVLRVLDES